MRVEVRVPAALAELAAGQRTVTVTVDGDGDATVAAVLDALAAMHPALERRVRDELGNVRTHVNMFVGADSIKDLDGTATPIGDGDELSIIAAISGG